MVDRRDQAGGLERAVDAELDGLPQRRLGAGVREDGEIVAGDRAIMARPLHGVSQRIVALQGVRIARLSGSGPTCFALFATEAEAQRAADTLAVEFPNWWVAASALS